MGWKLNGSPHTGLVTKEIADRFANMEPAPHDRPLSERRLQVYTRLLNMGEFRPVTWAVAYCLETDTHYRVNGKHTSTMLSGMEDMPKFYITVEDYICDTLEDVAKLYATFDSKMASRTSRDINLSFAATVNELKDVAASVINLAVAGMSYHLWQDKAYQKQAAERAELLLEHHKFVCWMQEMGMSNRGKTSTTMKSSHMTRSPVVAAMFGTWLRDQTAATEFWTAVRDESGTTPNLPDRKLARYLLTNNMSTRGIGKGSGPAREMYVKCLHAWGAWRRGESTNLNYYPDAKVPAIR